ncbi:MAG TPA: aminoacyl--tRNA ligase-related protein, partial [Patescibacteria group bacterium]|nr:aminoacyl--tRNA ligase-related protein [Patescibacteria group bacterium]
MRYSQLFPKTLKEAPKDEVAINAQLLIRGGFIDKLMAGSYSLLPLGRRVERKIEQIIREEMDKTGAQEILMPLLHPKEIWNETGRWDSAKEVMYQFEKDDKEYALSFTHEEIVMDLLRKHVNSYKDLPAKVYHFSTKFRSELRAKSGVLREREFVMKDAYSAHVSKEDLMEYYWQVAEAYLRIFERIGLDAKITEASGGVFTEDHTHEFQVLCAAGEDTIYFKDGWRYWKNKEVMSEEELNDADIRSEAAVEVGNIFPLGTMYSEKMNALFTDQDGSRQPIWFGSYGIGPKRVMGVVVEVFHDDRGIIWPESISPFAAQLIGLNERVDLIYNDLSKAGIDVLYDDRSDVGTGSKFADADLLGMPVRLVVSDKTGDKIE